MLNIKNLVVYITIFTFIIYLLTLFGIYKFNPEYLNSIETTLKILIGLILIFRYNPFIYHNKTFTDIDRRICFSAGIILLLNTSIVLYLKSHFENQIKNILNINI